MSYRLHAHAALDGDVRRIAREQIGKAIDELSDETGDRHEAVHDARKRFKKLRGLLRLVANGKPGFFRAENARYRDAARRLSGTRDRTALIEALDGLEKRFSGEVETQSFAVLRTALELKRQAAIETQEDLGTAVAATLEDLRDGRSKLDGFVLRHRRGAQRALVLGGLEANYRRARADLGRAIRTGESDTFHDLRKRMKYLGMHFKLLESLWPEALEPLRTEAERVADDLGRDHDYAVLRAEMAADPASFGARADLDVVLALMDRHQSELRAASIGLSQRLLAEKPAAFAQRFDRLWRIAEKRPRPAAPPEPPEADRRRAPLPA